MYFAEVKLCLKITSIEILYYVIPSIFRIIRNYEHKLRVFENRVLRRIFGTKRDEVTGEWRKFHNEELYDLYSSPSIIRIIKSRK
jgi:hypothetical protein